MKQWVTFMDGVERLRMIDVEEPAEPADDEVLVKIRYVSLNYRDVKFGGCTAGLLIRAMITVINGDFKARYGELSSPTVPLSDASGVIVAVGAGVQSSASQYHWQVGDEVFNLVRPSHMTGPTRGEHHSSGIGIPQPGVLTQYRLFKAAGLVRVPEYMNLEEACTLPIAGLTAWMALNWDRPIDQPRRGPDVVVLLQGTGGVSVAALQQANALGLTTIITSSCDAKLQKARSLGADHTINYKRTPQWAEEVLRITNGEGADLVIDTGGAGTLSESLKSVAAGGVVSAVGVLSGLHADNSSQVDVGLSLINRNAALKGINVGPKERMEELLRLYAAKQIQPVIDRVFDYEAVGAAMEYLRAGSHFGKIAIKVD